MYEVWVCLLERWVFKGRFSTRKEADDYVASLKAQIDLQCEIRERIPNLGEK